MTGPEMERRDRIVFLGDSITDGFTGPLLLRQALQEAGRPVPLCINAGVAGDMAEGMARRLDRDVLPHQPTLVSLSVGINDVLHRIPVEEYEARLSSMAERLKAAGIPMLVLTTTVLGPRHEEADRRLAGFNEALRRTAQKHGYRVAEVNQRMREAAERGEDVLEADQIHLSFRGYRAMVRALLDSLGHADVRVPQELLVQPMPGILREWSMRPMTKEDPPLGEPAVAALTPDASWVSYTLPEDQPVEGWWVDQIRRQGYAVSIEKHLGPAPFYVGVSFLDAPEARRVFFNTGALLRSVWLNGRQIYQNREWTGFHAGKERLPATLRPGRNVVVIETGSQFFLSVTDTDTW